MIAKIDAALKELNVKRDEITNTNKINNDRYNNLKGQLANVKEIREKVAPELKRVELMERQPTMWSLPRKFISHSWDKLVEIIERLFGVFKTLLIDKGGDYVVLAIVIFLLIYGGANYFGKPSFLSKPPKDPKQEEAQRNIMNAFDRFMSRITAWINRIFDLGYPVRALMNMFSTPNEQTTPRSVTGGRCDNINWIETDTLKDTSGNTVPACVAASTPSDIKWSLDTSKFDQWDLLPSKIRDESKLTLYMPYKLTTDQNTYIPDCSNTYYLDPTNPNKHITINMYDAAGQFGCVPKEVDRTPYTQTEPRAEAGVGYVSA